MNAYHTCPQVFKAWKKSSRSSEPSLESNLLESGTGEWAVSDSKNVGSELKKREATSIDSAKGESISLGLWLSMFDQCRVDAICVFRWHIYDFIHISDVIYTCHLYDKLLCYQAVHVFVYAFGLSETEGHHAGLGLVLLCCFRLSYTSCASCCGCFLKLCLKLLTLQDCQFWAQGFCPGVSAWAMALNGVVKSFNPHKASFMDSVSSMND